MDTGDKDVQEQLEQMQQHMSEKKFENLDEAKNLFMQLIQSLQKQFEQLQQEKVHLRKEIGVLEQKRLAFEQVRTKMTHALHLHENRSSSSLSPFVVGGHCSRSNAHTHACCVFPAFSHV